MQVSFCVGFSFSFLLVGTRPIQTQIRRKTDAKTHLHNLSNIFSCVNRQIMQVSFCVWFNSVESTPKPRRVVPNSSEFCKIQVSNHTQKLTCIICLLGSSHKFVIAKNTISADNAQRQTFD